MNTIIIPDTNSWKFTGKRGKACYDDYKFAGEMKIVAEFLDRYNLQNQINIVLPDFVLKEQKRQIRACLLEDLKSSERLARYKLIPKQKKSKVLTKKWEKDFDLSVKNFLKENSNITLIKKDGRKANKILEGITNRYFSHKAPFKNSDDFMDTLIWENTINNIDLNIYTNVIILTNDKGFSGCQNELQLETERNCSIFTNGESVVSQLKSLYYQEVTYADMYKYIDGDYFGSSITEKIQDAFSSQYPNQTITSYDTSSWSSIMEIDDSDPEVTFFTINDHILWDTDDGKQYSGDLSIVLDNTKEILTFELDNITRANANES